MELLFLSEVIAESLWRAMGWVCDERPNAVMNTLKHVFKWRSTQWWQSTKAVEMKNDLYNHTRWKHKWGWHNRECVWDKVAAEWAGKEEWCCKRIRCQNLEEKQRFVTFVKSVNHSRIHRTRTGRKKEGKAKEQVPRKLGPAVKTSHTRGEGPTVQLCGDSEVAGGGSMVNAPWRRYTEKDFAKFRTPYICWQALRSAMADAAALILEVHGRVLRMACTRLDQHYEGLAKIARVLAQRNMIDGSMKRTLLSIDTAAAFVRHITLPKNDMLLIKLEQMLTPPAATYAATAPAETVAPDHVAHISQLLEPPVPDKFVHVPIVQVMQVPQVHDKQLQIIEKTVHTLDIQTVHGTQNFSEFEIFARSPCGFC